MAMQKSLNNIDVKRINKTRIFRAISECEKISQQDIASRLAISIPTVVQNVRELVLAGLVREAGAFESTGGRKAKALALVPKARLTLGLDFTRTHVAMVAVDLAGRKIREERVVVPFVCDTAYFAAAGKALDAFVERETFDSRRILGVGVSIPGIINRNGTRIDYSHILGITGLPVDTITRHLPYPAIFINDANAAGFAEFRFRRGIQNAVYLSLCHSVGGSILFNGELYLGENQRSGEFGHNTVVPDGIPCYCGKRGCYDAYGSSIVLTREVKGGLEEFFALLDRGSPSCRGKWEEYTHFLAVAVNNLRMTFDCDVIVGGTVGGYLEGRDAPLRNRLAQLNTFEPDGSYLQNCLCKTEAAATGAALQHLALFEDNL